MSSDWKGGGVGMVHKYQHVLGVMVEALTCVYEHSGIVLSFTIENVLDYPMFMFIYFTILLHMNV